MKKAVVLLIFIIIFSSVCPLFVFASPTEVYVKISTDKLHLANEKVSVTDADNDDKITINDALFCAHEQFYTNGSDGYGTEMGAYGIYLSKMWGCSNGVSFGYYLNNSPAASLLDEIKNGDLVSAFSYNDMSTFSDIYCFFDYSTKTAQAGEPIVLTLKGMGYDENWAPITFPLKDIDVTVDGTTYKTDENGNVSFTISKAGIYTVSASSDTSFIVPPACIITVQSPSNPDTSDAFTVVFASLIISLTALAVLTRKRHEN